MRDGDLAHASDVVIQAMAEQLRRDGYQLKGVLGTLFRSRWFYDPANRGAKIKSPVQLVVSALRMLQTPWRDLDILLRALEVMGQKLMDPPAVAGWPGGQSWINASTLFSRQNTTTYMISGKLPYNDGWTTAKIDYDPRQVMPQQAMRSPKDLVEHLISTLLAVEPAPLRKDMLVKIAQEHQAHREVDAAVGLLLAITAMQEFQLT